MQLQLLMHFLEHSNLCEVPHIRVFLVFVSSELNNAIYAKFLIFECFGFLMFWVFFLPDSWVDFSEFILFFLSFAKGVWFDPQLDNGVKSFATIKFLRCERNSSLDEGQKGHYVARKMRSIVAVDLYSILPHSQSFLFATKKSLCTLNSEFPFVCLSKTLYHYTHCFSIVQFIPWLV